MNHFNPFLNKLILQISLIWFDKANPNKANNLRIDANLPATLISGYLTANPYGSRRVVKKNMACLHNLGLQEGVRPHPPRLNCLKPTQANKCEAVTELCIKVWQKGSPLLLTILQLQLVFYGFVLNVVLTQKLPPNCPQK